MFFIGLAYGGFISEVCMTITIDVLKRALPEKYKRGVNQALLDSIHQTLSDPVHYEEYRNNFISYMSVLDDGKYKLQDYMNAVKYVTHKLMGNSNTDAYVKTFPDRYASMVSKGMSSKEISSFITAYNKNKLVNAIMEQSMIPSWIINQDLYQKAINVQAELMLTANSEKVRSDAANSLLVHLKPPEVKKVELDVGLKKNNDVEELKTVLAQLAGQQRQLIQSGVMTAKETAETKLIGQVIEHE